MAETLTLRALNRATLARQLLLAREPLGAVEAVDRLAGLHAQEPKPPFLALHARLDGFARDDLLAPIRSGALLRGTLMRGTLHLVTAADFAAWRTLVSSDEAAVRKVLGARAEGLDAAGVLPVARALLAEEPRTFTALRAALVERFPDVHERALGFCARMLLPLTMVPSADPFGFPRDAAFAVAPVEPAAGADAAREALVLRYLAAFGPASVADAQAWSGLKGLKPTFDALRDRLVTFRAEHAPRRELFDLPDAPRPPADTPAPPRLLGEFDQLLLAHDDRSRTIADEHRPLVVTKNLRVKAVFLVDGTAAGTWTLTTKRAAATLQLDPFPGVRIRAKRPLLDEAERVARWLEPDARDVSVGLA